MRCQPPCKALVYNWSNSNHECLLCNEATDQHYPLCVACETELPWLEDGCQVCALPLPMHGLTCGQCSRRAPAFYRVEAPWHYGFPLDALISRFKYHSQWPLGRLLATLLGRWLTHRFSEGLPHPTLLLPVPLSRRRLRQRGYNQAAMLAQWLSGQIGISSNERILKRLIDTPAQQGLKASERKRNLRQAFAVEHIELLEGRHLALVDDVLTTGATAQALASLLLKAGARRVDVYCLARTAKPGSA
ncbi:MULTISPECIES: ComF family protein [Pseudomonas]|jgi:ComF family protein|uniref:Double zinc ribbon domain-containing protein n=1 Tax=Pseudomonas sp. Hg7Tf TaxID=3236988 RepID=A0AB39HW65_9PSED|nr:MULTISPECIES: ComF family protein [Pseudomonas]KJK09340.1 amidophosphoribosyltransferase [Pseudomonas sp. 5]MDD1976399.1 ComF family protein [Pseudomonas putida]MDH2560970.1 ComF family protein [Pseudomonas sp. Hg5Tf]QYX46802.1 ComF family protein [Pseudomonas sp. S11A 273]